MLQIGIINMLTITALLLTNIILTIMTYILIDEFINWKGENKNE